MTGLAARPAGRFALAGGVALFLLLAGMAAVRDASVADEQPHILAGWLLWKTHAGAGGFDNPPLGQLVVAAPLALFNLPYRFPDDALLLWCRLPVLLVTAGLGVLLWRWGRVLGGTGMAAVTLGMFALEPNILAQGHVATLDALVTACWWAALWHWRQVLLRPGHALPWRALAAFAVCTAAAVMVKLSALLLLPAALAVAWGVGRAAGSRRRALAGVALAAVATVGLAHVLYGFAPLEWLLPQPLVEALRGKAAHRGEVQFAYLAGRRSADGFWLYYLIGLAVKLPLPMLALAVWGARGVRRWAVVDRALILLPALIVCIAFTLVRVNIGVRHVLPAVPALVLLAAAGANDLWRRGRAARTVVCGLGIWWLAGIVHVTPQYFAFFNEIAGGPAGGHRWLLDSNLAWGQDDRRVQAFLAQARTRGENWQVLPDPDLPRAGNFVVEVNALHNLQRRSARPYEWLRDLRPVGSAGWSWRCYALDLAAFAAAAARRPHDAAAVVAYAEAARAAGDSVQARAALAAAAAHDPGGVAERVARLALGRGDWRAAAAWLDGAAGAGAHSAELERLAVLCGLQRAVATAADAAQRTRSEAALGIWYGEHGQRRQAVELLSRAAANPAADAETWRAWAIAQAQTGAYAAARDILIQANLQTVYTPEFELCSKLAAAAAAVQAGRLPAPDVAFELGRGLFESEQYDAAAAAFAATLRAAPGHRLALAYLGEMQVRCKMRVVNQSLSPRSVLTGG